MEPLILEKPSFHQIYPAYKEGNYIQSDSTSSPQNRFSVGTNQTDQRKIPSNKSNRILAQLLELNSIVNNIQTPKNIPSHKSHIHGSSSVLSCNPILEEQPRVSKNQPRISNNSLLPPVFSNEKAQATKIRKLIKKQISSNKTEISIEQEPQSVEFSKQMSPSRKDRFPKPFLSPARVLSPRSAQSNSNLGQRGSINSVISRPSDCKRPAFTRDSVRRMPTEVSLIREKDEDNYLGLKTEESMLKNDESHLNGTPSSKNLNNGGCSKKMIVVFRKFLSKSPESRIPQTEETKNLVFDAVKFVDNFAQAKPTLKTKICFNEMITLQKIRTMESGGTMKKMLHAPTLSIYDIHEEPIKGLESLKGWVNLWKKSFTKKENVPVRKIFKCFWNFPEGSVSVLMESSNKASLQDLLDVHFSLPESCIQQVAANITKGVHEIHESMKVPHGAVCSNEIFFDSQSEPKLSPGLSSKATSKTDSPQKSLNKEPDYDRVLKPRLASAGQIQFYTPQALNSNSNQNTQQQIAADIFDLGYLLLTCALGTLDFYDNTGFFNLEKLKNTIELFVNIRGQNKNYCCLLHCEAELRKFHSELSPTTRIGDPSFNSPSKINFQLKSTNNQETSSVSQKRGSPPFSLLELLQRNNRHSENFIDFLCKCLHLQASNRPDARSLTAHKFLYDENRPTGPLISISELLATSKKFSEPRINEESTDERLNRVFEAIKIVLLNRDARDKIAKFTNGRRFENPQSREYRKLQDLAFEFGVPVRKVMAKFREEILPSLLI